MYLRGVRACTYLKVTNKKELHYDHQYQPGLNILQGKFNDDPNDLCGPGGFYFTLPDNINNYYDYGINIREIFLPMDNPNFKMINLGHKFRSNMVILGNKYSLLDIKTYQKFNLDPEDNKYMIDRISIEGDLESLILWQTLEVYSEKRLSYNKIAIDTALFQNNIDILFWWFNSKLELKYSKNNHLSIQNLCSSFYRSDSKLDPK